MDNQNDFSLILGDIVNDAREKTGDVVKVSETDLESSTWILGVQGSGKSSLIESYVYQLACRKPKKGMVIIDPHGDLINNILKQLPDDRLQDTYLLDLLDRDYLFGLNIFDAIDIREGKSVDVDNAIDWVKQTFEKMFEGASSRGILLPKILGYITRVAVPNRLAITDVPRLIDDDRFRAEMLKNVTHYRTLRYWQKFGEMKERARNDETRALENRLEILLSRELLEMILGQEKTTIDFRKAMDSNEIILVRLPVAIYPEVARLVGCAFVTEVYRAAFSYEDTSRDERRGFAVLVDEAHEFATKKFAELISGTRKYGLRLFLGNQAHDQWKSEKNENYNAVQSCRQRVVLRLNDDDAREMGSAYLDKDKEPALKHLENDVLAALKKHKSYDVYLFNQDVIERLREIQKDKKSEDNIKEVENIKGVIEMIATTLLFFEHKRSVDADCTKYIEYRLEEISEYFGFAKYYELKSYYDARNETVEKLKQTLAFLEGLELWKVASHWFVRYFPSSDKGQKAYVSVEQAVADDKFWENMEACEKGEHLQRLLEKHVDFFLKELAAYANKMCLVTVDEMIETVVERGKNERIQKAYELKKKVWLEYAEKHEALANNEKISGVIRKFHREQAQYILSSRFDFNAVPSFAYLLLTEAGYKYVPFLSRFFDPDKWYTRQEERDMRTHRIRVIYHSYPLFERLTYLKHNSVFGDDILLPGYYWSFTNERGSFANERFADEDRMKKVRNVPLEGYKIEYTGKKGLNEFTQNFIDGVDKGSKYSYGYDYVLEDDIDKVLSKGRKEKHVWKYGASREMLRSEVEGQNEEYQKMVEDWGTPEKIMVYIDRVLQGRIVRIKEQIAKEETAMADLKRKMSPLENAVNSYRKKLTTVCEILAKEPIGEYEKKETAVDVATKLNRLDERYGYIRVNKKIYQIKTPDRPIVVDDETFERRLLLIQKQTRVRYCKSRDEIEKELVERRKKVWDAGLKGEAVKVYSVSELDDEEFFSEYEDE